MRAQKIESVFEVCDTTDDELYFPLGIFLTLDDARQEIEKHNQVGEKVSDRAEESETISILERRIGWTEHGTRVDIFERVEYYDDESDEYRWRTV